MRQLKIEDSLHKEIMKLRYTLGYRSASQVIQHLLVFYNGG